SVCVCVSLCFLPQWTRPAAVMAVSASMELGAENSVLSAPHDGSLLSEKLVELKRLCMDRLADYLLRHHATADVAASDDPLMQDDLEAVSEEEENTDTNSNPLKKRK
ncbi:hypothetical protein GOP47_0008982, partial [Adiantum capillus-veneris]